ncbi:MAG: hypothetical protein ACOCXG_02620 [Nanoarchaeota archaeon]
MDFDTTRTRRKKDEEFRNMNRKRERFLEHQRKKREYEEKVRKNKEEMERKAQARKREIEERERKLAEEREAKERELLEAKLRKEEARRKRKETLVGMVFDWENLAIIGIVGGLVYGITSELTLYQRKSIRVPDESYMFVSEENSGGVYESVLYRKVEIGGEEVIQKYELSKDERGRDVNETYLKYIGIVEERPRKHVLNYEQSKQFEAQKIVQKSKPESSPTQYKHQ